MSMCVFLEGRGGEGCFEACESNKSEVLCE